jgi:hypothetical protein
MGRKHQLICVLVVLCAAFLRDTPQVAAGQFGAFDGRVAVEWLSDGGLDRDMRLLEPFAYRDQDGKIWSVPAGAVINGASIPQVLWSIIGSPYTGGYRRASVSHDYYCSQESGFPEPYQDVHRMFYNAARAGGVDEFSARRMYYAILAFGPKWKRQRIVKTPAPGEPPMALSLPIVSTWQPEISEQQVREFLAWIESANPSEAEIEARARAFSSFAEPPDTLVLPPAAAFTPMR